MRTLLALDGPCNGQYIDQQTAFVNGYEPYQWPTGEWVYAQAHVLEAQGV